MVYQRPRRWLFCPLKNAGKDSILTSTVSPGVPNTLPRSLLTEPLSAFLFAKGRAKCRPFHPPCQEQNRERIPLFTQMIMVRKSTLKCTCERKSSRIICVISRSRSRKICGAKASVETTKEDNIQATKSEQWFRLITRGKSTRQRQRHRHRRAGSFPEISRKESCLKNAS